VSGAATQENAKGKAPGLCVHSRRSSVLTYSGFTFLFCFVLWKLGNPCSGNDCYGNACVIVAVIVINI
jgi:hypothetical protein